MTTATATESYPLVNLQRAAQLLGVQWGFIESATSRGDLRVALEYVARDGKRRKLVDLRDLERFRRARVERWRGYKGAYHARIVRNLEQHPIDVEIQ